MMRRLLSTLPLLVAAALYALVTQSFVVAGLVGSAVVLAVPLAGYIDAPPFVQRATLLVVGLFGALGGATALRDAEPEIATRPSAVLGGVAVTAMMLAAARRFFRDPEGGPRVDFGLVTVAVAVCGQRHIGPPYVALAVLFVVAVIAMLRARDRESGWSVVESSSPLALAGMLAVIASFSALGMVALPRLATLTQRQFDLYVLPKSAAQVGFVDKLVTGSPDTLIPSDEIVLRIYGPHVDYLRGRIYDQFERGNWGNTRRSAPIAIKTAIGKPEGPSVVELRGVGPLVHANQFARFFVPLGARRLGTAKGSALVDELSTFFPAIDEPPTPFSFEIGTPEFAVAAPTDADLRVTDERVVGPLQSVALEWTRGESTDGGKLSAIERHLTHEFTYTLDGVPFSREPSIVNFVLHTRRGRCELFATAMALLGRLAGVPTRVVGGFRVAEHNAIGGYDVVREKNAHAWVEGWVDGAWRTFEPTPATEANLRRDSRAGGAIGDAMLAGWDRALEILGRAALWQFGVVLGGAVALLTTVRVLRARRERRRSAVVADSADDPLPYFTRLESVLARSGHPRAPTEPLERYAERLRGAEQATAADVVLDYSALRYGGIGDGAALSKRAEACAEAIARTLPA